MDSVPLRPQLTVNLAALRQNAKTLMGRAAPAQLAPVVKANAYGLGAAPIAKTLALDLGLRHFFVAYTDEAKLVQGAVPGATVYVLNGPDVADMAELRRDGIRPVLSSPEQISLWMQMNGGPCALSIDIGMNRLGLTMADAWSASERLPQGAVEVILMHLSHSGAADAPQNREQAARFRATRASLAPVFPGAAFSLSASGGLTLDLFCEETLARPGIALYGGAPSGEPSDALAPVASLTAPVLLTRLVPKGASVGYNGQWTADADTPVAVLGIGYADGVHRTSSPAGEVSIGGIRCPLIGAVSMDLIAVDVSPLNALPTIGTRAEIFGNTLLLDEAANNAGTIGYELLTSIGPRVMRTYTDDGA